MNGHSIVKSAIRVLDVLDILAEHPEGLVFTELQAITNFPNSSLHGLLSSMAYKNYIRRDQETKRYRLSFKLLQFNSVLQTQSDLIALSDPWMDKIRSVSRETTSLSLLDGNSILFIHKKPGPGRIQVINPAGTRLPAYATGSGKVMLAYLPGEELDALYPEEDLPKITENTVTSRSALKELLQKIRRDGYAFDNEESSPGIWAVAGCIRTDTGRPLAALSIVAPISTIQMKDTSSWPGLVRDAAEEISKGLAFYASA